jgi:dihydrofolate synthase/folylpolyglutamate synthase
MSHASVRAVEDEYGEAYKFLCSLERFGILLGLENIGILLENLGNPQRAFPVIHVGGSNGKGSTAALLCGILREAGLKTALYTSPHLNDFRERIRINGSMISREAVIASTRKIRSIYNPDRTTFFEFTTAVAFDCMAQAKPDMAVVEVGLGGRLDATNTVEPLVTIITDVSREHEDYLGVGIASVAREKAGIIKPKVPLLTGASRSEARQILRHAAEEKDAPIREFGRDFRTTRTGTRKFNYASSLSVVEDLTLAMPGAHQIKNAALACAAVEELRGMGYAISDAAVREGIRNTRFAGRFEIINKSPDVIIDGAHTPESMRLLKSTFRQLYPSISPLVLMGMLREKNWKEMAKIITPVAREVVCVTPQGDRALDAEQLASHVRECGVPVTVSDTIEHGFQTLFQKASRDQVVLAAGSLYMIGPVRRACGLGEE